MKKNYSILLTMMLCFLGVMQSFGQAKYHVLVNSPVAGEIPVVGVAAGWGTQVSPDAPLTADAVLANDGSAAPTLGCQASAAGAYEGKIVVIRRGTCGFVVKAKLAQDAGAVAVFIVNTIDGVPADMPIVAAAPPTPGTSEVNIPVVMLPYTEGEALIAGLGVATVNVSLVREPIDPGNITLIWGGPGIPTSEFDGGFNDWTAVGVSCSPALNGDPVDGANATWQWAEYPRSIGGYAGPRGTIHSLSAYNGAVLFDSDYIDNLGTQGAFGVGPCPSAHRAELISPVIDLTGQTSVAVRFNQYYRRFGGPGSAQGTPGTFIEVTTDGGATWTPFTLNANIAVNAFSPINDVQLVDISTVAANQPAVQFKFVFDGDYYMWQIDDVYLVALPENSIGINRAMYPIVSRYTPAAFIGSEQSWPFSAAIRNFGGNTIEDAILRVEVVHVTGGNAIVHEDNLAVDPFAPSADDFVVQFPDPFLPAGLTPGEYRISYSILQEGVEDFDPSNNTLNFTFFVTDNDYWQSGEPRTTLLVGGLTSETWGYGALFETSADTQEDYKITSAEVFAAAQTGGAPAVEGVELVFYMLKLIGDGPIAGSLLGDGETNDFAGFGSHIMTATDNNAIIELAVLDDADEEMILENGTNYYGMVFVPANLRIGSDNQAVNYPVTLETTSVLLFSRIYFNGGFSSTFRNTTPYVKLNLALVVSTDNNPLPETAMTVYPNPANDYILVDLDMDKMTKVTITLADINGRVIKYDNFQNVTTMQHRFDTSNLTAGTYLVRVASPEGTSTKKLVVTK